MKRRRARRDPSCRRCRTVLGTPTEQRYRGLCSSCRAELRREAPCRYRPRLLSKAKPAGTVTRGRAGLHRASGYPRSERPDRRPRIGASCQGTGIPRWDSCAASPDRDGVERWAHQESRSLENERLGAGVRADLCPDRPSVTTAATRSSPATKAGSSSSTQSPAPTTKRRSTCGAAPSLNAYKPGSFTTGQHTGFACNIDESAGMAKP